MWHYCLYNINKRNKTLTMNTRDFNAHVALVNIFDLRCINDPSLTSLHEAVREYDRLLVTHLAADDYRYRTYVNVM